LISPETLGFIGGGIITGSLIPQVHRVFKLKSAHDISLLFTIMLLIGLIFWVNYGLAFNLAPIILWNSISLGLAVLLLYAKLKYGR
jgi:MtN3 and saliva related transmembrane protein